MDVFEAVRTRRTYKSYSDEALSHDELSELFELARWAPNHKLTEPWRFRVVGPEAMERLRKVVINQAREGAPDGADPEKIAAVALKKLAMAPTVVAVTTLRNQDPMLDVEDYSSTSVATYLLLLAAHAKGYASFWRSPGVLQSAEGSAALGIGTDEEPVGMVYLGKPGEIAPAPGRRSPIENFVEYLA
jgi:nitroreductase